jgi:hypothetical protein
MKIYAMYVFDKTDETARLIDSASDFSDVGFFYRGSALEVCTVVAQNLAASPSPDRLTTVQERSYMFHKLRVRDAVALIVATQDYPSRVAFGILREIMREYEACAGLFPNGKSSVIHRVFASISSRETQTKSREFRKTWRRHKRS